MFYFVWNSSPPDTVGSARLPLLSGLLTSLHGLSWPDAGGQAQGWAGPGRPAHPIIIWWAAARPGPSNFQRIGRGPARPIKFSEDGPPPGPAHHIFQKFTARPIIFSKVSARLGQAHHMATRPMKHGLYMGRPDSYVGRPMCCPVLAGACAEVIP